MTAVAASASSRGAKGSRGPQTARAARSVTAERRKKRSGGIGRRGSGWQSGALTLPAGAPVAIAISRQPDAEVAALPPRLIRQRDERLSALCRDLSRAWRQWRFLAPWLVQVLSAFNLSAIRLHGDRASAERFP